LSLPLHVDANGRAGQLWNGSIEWIDTLLASTAGAAYLPLPICLLSTAMCDE
jgi:hypothetical protein